MWWVGVRVHGPAGPTAPTAADWHYTPKPSHIHTHTHTLYINPPSPDRARPALRGAGRARVRAAQGPVGDARLGRLGPLAGFLAGGCVGGEGDGQGGVWVCCWVVGRSIGCSVPYCAACLLPTHALAHTPPTHTHTHARTEQAVSQLLTGVSLDDYLSNNNTSTSTTTTGAAVSTTTAAAPGSEEGAAGGGRPRSDSGGSSLPSWVEWNGMDRGRKQRSA